MKNENEKKIGTTIAFLISLMLLGSTIVNASINDNDQSIKENDIVFFDQTDTSVIVTIPVGEYEIINTEKGDEVNVEDFGRLLIPGKPNLPSKIFSIAIPPGTEVSDVNFDIGEGIMVTGIFEVPPSPLPRVIGEEDLLIYGQQKKMYDENFEFVYNYNDPYPDSIGEFVRTAGYRKYNLIDVRITPFTYLPLSGQLMYYPEITVEVTYVSSDEGKEIMVDNLVTTERIAEEIIINYDQTKNWYTGQTVLGKGLHDFVIITLDSLTTSVTPLVNWENSKGRNVEVVTTSWINSNYPDGYDLAENMRNFLRDKYPSEEWGIENVLLVGDYDDVPMRRCWQDLGYGKPETDYYYAELSLPDDESWDADEDHRYGEDYSDPIDFYTEINVGRIPWSTPSTVQHICEKSVVYEENNAPSFKRNILLLGAFFWDNDPNPRTDNAVLMEYKTNPDIHPWMEGWTTTKMYEEGHSTYPMDYDLTNSNVVSVWSTGSFAFVNWAGHGSPDACWIYHDSGYFICNDDTLQLNDEYPAIIFADACSNSDTDYLNIGKAMLKQGGVGFVGSTKVALGCPGWDHPDDGSSQSMDYYFTTSVTSGEYTQGEAHQRALREMYTQGLWSYTKYEMFEWGALWGNPGLGMAPIGDVPIIEIDDFSTGIGSVKTSITNSGSADANDVSWSISITGGILGLINATTEGTIDSLGIDESVEIKTDGLLFGLGGINIIVTAGFSTKTEQGFILGPIIILTE